MDAASVLGFPKPPQTRACHCDRKVKVSNLRSGMALARHERSRREAGLPNATRYPYRITGLRNYVKLCSAIVLFVLTWVFTHLIRGHLGIRPYDVSTSSDCVTLIRSPTQIYSCLQASALQNIARVSPYLETNIFAYILSSNKVDDPTVIPTFPPNVTNPVHSEAPAAAASVVNNGHSQNSPTIVKSKQEFESSIPNQLGNKSGKNLTSHISRPQQNSAPPRDFALNTEYISSLTSHTHSNLGLRQIFGLRIFSSIAGFDVGRTLGQCPAMALVDGGNNEQSCWIFPGSHGHLGIPLKERISVEKFTIDHLPRDMLPDFAILQAPRKVILWGRVDGPDNLSKAQVYLENMGDEHSSLYANSRFFGSTAERNHRDLFIPLANFEYKLSGQPQSSVQTKEISRALQSLRMDFEVVVLEILSNWGATSTCLYRVRVHGNLLKAVALRPISP